MAAIKPQIRSLFATPSVCISYLWRRRPTQICVRCYWSARAKRCRVAKGPMQKRISATGATIMPKPCYRWLLTLPTVLQHRGRRTRESRMANRRSRCDARQGEHQEMTTRPAAFWSGVYFADDGYGKSDDEALGGQCELGDPRGPMPRWCPHNSAFVCRAVRAPVRRNHPPQSGMILLHPGWLPRGERRYEGEGQRLVIEFELIAPA